MDTHDHWNFDFPKHELVFSDDCAGASGLRLTPFISIVAWLHLSIFLFRFVESVLTSHGSLLRWAETGRQPSQDLFIRAYQDSVRKFIYATVLAPLQALSLQPKGFFRRSRGPIYVAFGEHTAAEVCVQQSCCYVFCLFVCLRVFVCLCACVCLVVC